MHRWTPPVRPRRRSRWTSEKRFAATGVKYRYSGVDPGRGRDGQSTRVSRTAGSSELQLRTFGGWPHLTMPARTRVDRSTCRCRDASRVLGYRCRGARRSRRAIFGNCYYRAKPYTPRPPSTACRRRGPGIAGPSGPGGSTQRAGRDGDPGVSAADAVARRRRLSRRERRRVDSY